MYIGNGLHALEAKKCLGAREGQLWVLYSLSSNVWESSKIYQTVLTEGHGVKDCVTKYGIQLYIDTGRPQSVTHVFVIGISFILRYSVVPVKG